MSAGNGRPALMSQATRETMHNIESVQLSMSAESRYPTATVAALQMENEALRQTVQRQAEEIKALDYRISTLLGDKPCITPPKPPLIQVMI